MTTFYPIDELAPSSSLRERLETLMDAAERYKSATLEIVVNASLDTKVKKRMTPREIQSAFNWQEISRIMREVRELSEGSNQAKSIKADALKKLADVYEVLRGAKMPKLEAVRLALLNEATQISR